MTSTAILPSSPTLTWLRRIIWIGTAVYWLGLFVLTHTPVTLPPRPCQLRPKLRVKSRPMALQPTKVLPLTPLRPTKWMAHIKPPTKSRTIKLRPTA